MAKIKTKVLCVKKLGWKRIARNTERFGWTLDEAEQETTTTHETTYEGKIIDNKVYVKSHTNTSTTIRIWLSFWRNKDDFKNLTIIRPLELIYNIIFTIRRIIGFFMPIATILLIIGTLFLNATGSGYHDEMNRFFIILIVVFLIWLLLMICEGIFSRIAGAILKRK